MGESTPDQLGRPGFLWTRDAVAELIGQRYGRWLARTTVGGSWEGGVVLWLDEMGVGSDAATGRSWAPIGKTPVIKRTGKRFRVNMLSAISNGVQER